MRKILMILTSHGTMDRTDVETGVWLGEFTGPYYEMLDNGCEVTIASPKGGQPPVDPMSRLTENITASNRRFQDDTPTQLAFANTVKIDEVVAADYDGVFYPGGHGPLWDLANNEVSGRLIVDMLNSNKPVATLCHGPAALIKAAALQPGLLKDKRITCFTNTEEALVFRSENIPYKLETALKKLGANVQSALLPMTAHVEVDGLLISGQNPLSAEVTAKAFLKAVAIK